jgi:hypothetical protein
MSRAFLRQTFLAAACLLLLPASRGAAAVLLRWDFEGGSPFHDLKIEGEPPVCVPDPLNPANQVMRSVLRTDSARSERSEVRWDSIHLGEERWVGLRILVPEPSAQSFLCLFQLGPIKFRGDERSTGYFQVWQSNGTQWTLRGFLERFGGKAVRLDCGPIPMGRWETWIAHFKVTDDETGLLEFWRGDTKVFEQRGPNAKRGTYALPLKWGIYIGIGNKLKQGATVYFDNIIVADRAATFGEMQRLLEP